MEQKGDLLKWLKECAENRTSVTHLSKLKTQRICQANNKTAMSTNQCLRGKHLVRKIKINEKHLNNPAENVQNMVKLFFRLNYRGFLIRLYCK